jgi:hypothetical protein
MEERTHAVVRKSTAILITGDRVVIWKGKSCRCVKKWEKWGRRCWYDASFSHCPFILKYLYS